MQSYCWILIVIAAIVMATVCVLVLRAVLAKKNAVSCDAPRKNVDEQKLEKYVGQLTKMIECRTVADGNSEAEFAKFRQVLRQEFPVVHEKAEILDFDGCLVFVIKGKRASKNIMLMSHHDVVEEGGEWKYPAFCATVAEGALWGRGTVDTKTPLFAELRAAEELLSEGYDFEGINLYIGSSNNEERCGDGMPKAVAYFKENGIRFDTVLDEGGAVVCGMMPGVKRKSAMVAVHEKGRHTFICTALSTDKGHLGLNPVKSNAIDRLSAFITETKKAKLFDVHFYPEVREMFVRHAPYMSFPYRLLFANLWLFRPLLLKLLPIVSPQAGGMLSTTMNYTSIAGGSGSSQVMAKTATATAFFRCVREEELKLQLKEIEKRAAKYDIKISAEIVDYCQPYSAKQEQFKVLEKVLNNDYPDVIVSPYLLTAGTDARHFSDIADCILRFAPIDLNKQQFASVHNPNENITIENIGECVCFYKDYIKEVCVPKSHN